MRDDGANVVIIMILTKKTGKKVQKSDGKMRNAVHDGSLQIFHRRERREAEIHFL